MKKGITTALGLAFIIMGAMLGDSHKIGLCLTFVAIGCIIVYIVYGMGKEEKQKGKI
jgi:hypothetical protein